MANKDPYQTHKFTGKEIQNRFLERWINDVIKDAVEQDLPGLLKRPEHVQPLARYGVDKTTLENMGIDHDGQMKIYKALYVHSVGFYQIVKDITRHMGEGREALRVNIWKVFQILLESACATDYKLITQRMEELNVKNVQEILQKMNEMQKDIM